MDTARDSLVWVLFILEHIVVIDFQNKGNIAREVPRAGFDESKWSRISIAAGFDGEFEMIPRIIGRGVDGKAARRPVFESLINRQNNQAPGSGQLAVIQNSGE